MSQKNYYLSSYFLIRLYFYFWRLWANNLAGLLDKVKEIQFFKVDCDRIFMR